MTFTIAFNYGVDSYHLAIIFLLNLEMGFLIPPVGMNLFISSIRFGKSVSYVCRTVLPFLGILTVTLVVVTYVPWISTYLPSFIKVKEEGTSLGGGYIKLNDDEGELPEPPPLDDLGEEGPSALDELLADEPIDGGTPDGAVDGGGATGAAVDDAPGDGELGEGEEEPKEEPAPKAKPKAGKRAQEE